MTDPSAQAPGGWHPDPLNGEQQRWWDGVAWTDLVKPRDPGMATAATASGPVPTPFPQVQPMAPGWYPDPSLFGQQRWWDGHAWTSNAAPAVGGTASHSTVVVLNQPKSVGVAFILTFFFSSIGLFYATVTGGLIMLALEVFGTLLIGVVTFGFGVFVWLPLCWVVSIIWGCIAAGNSAGGGHTTVIQSSIRG